ARSSAGWRWWRIRPERQGWCRPLAGSLPIEDQEVAGQRPALPPPGGYALKHRLAIMTR
ncbi:phosphoenolpyruvate-protein phosphotransferase, partial [Stenotrophomonas maltophilia]